MTTLHHTWLMCLNPRFPQPRIADLPIQVNHASVRSTSELNSQPTGSMNSVYFPSQPHGKRDSPSILKLLSADVLVDASNGHAGVDGGMLHRRPPSVPGYITPEYFRFPGHVALNFADTVPRKR